jgi:hypothetical protein
MLTQGLANTRIEAPPRVSSNFCCLVRSYAASYKQLLTSFYSIRLLAISYWYRREASARTEALVRRSGDRRVAPEC